jgi:hypothetical protein
MDQLLRLRSRPGVVLVTCVALVVAVTVADAARAATG